jgi:DNA-binding YbaB/EbfC family protein
MKFGDMGKMMKQVQKMQADMAKMQEDLKEMTVEATAGWGVVRVVATGKQEIREIKIDPEVVNAEDVEMLEDLVLAAVNEALRKSTELQAEEMAKITGGIKIPGLF